MGSFGCLVDACDEAPKCLTEPGQASPASCLRRQAAGPQVTPVEWIGQYPFGFLSRYCWW